MNVSRVTKAAVNRPTLCLPPVLDGTTILLMTAVRFRFVFHWICTWIVFVAVENNCFVKYWVCSTNRVTEYVVAYASWPVGGQHSGWLCSYNHSARSVLSVYMGAHNFYCFSSVVSATRICNELKHKYLNLPACKSCPTCFCF